MPFHTHSSKFVFYSNPQRFTEVCYSEEEDASHLVAVEVKVEQEVRLIKLRLCLFQTSLTSNQNCQALDPFLIPFYRIETPMDVAKTRINHASHTFGPWLCCCCCCCITLKAIFVCTPVVAHLTLRRKVVNYL